jgi:hypothetical protein
VLDQIKQSRYEMDSGVNNRLGMSSTTNIAKIPMPITTFDKKQIVTDWQHHMDYNKWTMAACAVCAQRIPKKDIQIVQPGQFDFSLLQNPHLPDETRPTTYNAQAYDNVILYPKGLHCKKKGWSIRHVQKV